MNEAVVVVVGTTTYCATGHNKRQVTVSFCFDLTPVQPDRGVRYLYLRDPWSAQKSLEKQSPHLGLTQRWQITHRLQAEVGQPHHTGSN